jgi:dTDP-3-amino-3,4,6-trideoxy-alpha-D-glucose transaminase
VSAIEEQIPLARMDGCDPELMSQLLAAVREVAWSGRFVGGEIVERFESAFGAWCEAPHAIGVSSGTEALALALRALGVGAQDEVIVPANSFVATAEAVSLVGARPRFADVDRDTQLLTAETVARALTRRVRCIVPVHLYGRTVEMAPLCELAAEHGLSVLEDACQAHGARYRGRRVGTIGDAGAFSFYPAKNLGAWGDAGAVVTCREDLAAHVRLLRSHGEQPRYEHRVPGTTGRLDAIQAAVLTIKLERLESVNEGRRRAAALLREALRGEPSVECPVAPGEGCDHVYHQFVVRAARRDAAREALARCGIESAIHYPTPIHRTRAYAPLGEADAAPVADLLAREILSLPVHPDLDEHDAGRIADALSSLPEPSS